MRETRDLAAVAAVVAATAVAVQRPTAGRPAVSGADLLDALVLLRWAQTELAGLEPVLIAAARAAGVAEVFVRVVTSSDTDSDALKLLHQRKGRPPEALAICRAGTRSSSPPTGC